LKILRDQFAIFLKSYWGQLENFKKYEDQNAKFKNNVRMKIFEIPIF